MDEIFELQNFQDIQKTKLKNEIAKLQLISAGDFYSPCNYFQDIGCRCGFNQICREAE